ncbi:DUF3311 domain-containing protein [Streptomyces cacaoi]|uniref:DUF3311 domain-containing protein n=1 Tax=Streptomyces cacaoi TaxID=1898 RepID=UPI0037483417
MSEPAPPEGESFPRTRARRPALWLLLVPAVLYCLAPLVANSIEPRVLGVPFLLVWVIGATVLSPLVIWLAARLDPAFRSGALEPLPADDDPPRDGAAPHDGEGPGAGAAGGAR